MDIEQARQQAQSENTGSEILTELAVNEDILTRKYVASNPNTPVEILKKLAREFPEEIMANPVLDLLTLEDSGERLVVKKIGYDSKTSRKIYQLEVFQGIRVIIASNPDTPVRILNYLKNDPQRSVREKVASNPSTPVKILNYLKNDPQQSVRRKVVANPNTPDATLKKIATSLTECDSLVQQANFILEKRQAQNENTPSEILFQLVVKNRTKACISKAVAQNPNASKNPFMKLLCLTRNNEIGMAVAQHPNVSEKILDYLKEDEDWEIRLFVAQNPNVSAKTLDYLKEDKDDRVRLAAIEHDKTSKKILD